MKTCPKCKSSSKQRIKRKGIVKLISGAKRYLCDTCNTKYTWFPYVKLSLKI